MLTLCIYAAFHARWCVVAGVEERIAAWTLLPVGNGEGLQVLRYQKEQKYDA